VLLFIGTAAGSFAAAIYASELQGRDTQLGFRATSVTTGLWLTFQALGLLTADEGLSNALYIGGLICGLTGVGAWIYFISAYTGRSHHRDRRYRGLAVGGFVTLLATKLTNPLFGLYVATELQTEPYPHLVVQPQLFYWVSFALTYTLVAISFYWLLDTFRNSSYPTAGLGVLAALSITPAVPRLAVETLPSELLPPVLLGVSFEPLGVGLFIFGVLVLVEDTFRRVGQSAQSEFFEHANEATFVYDSDGGLIESNRQAQRLQTSLGMECPTVEAFERAFRPVGAADESAVVPVESDGSTRYFAVTANRMTIGAEGIGTVAWVREVTERRERKRELELKERAMDEATVGITISDPDTEDNSLVYVNDGFVDQTGYSRDAALGRNCRFLQADDRDQSALDDLRDAIAAERPSTVELRNYRDDGELFWNRLSVTPVYDDDGELVNYIGIQQDVTERKERERELRAEREQFRLLVESADEYAFIVVGEDGAIQTWNDGAENLFGYDAAAAVGMPMARLHTETDREAGRSERLLQQARIAGEASDDGWRVRADGVEFYADVRYARLETDDGEFRGYAHIVRDMTEQRRRRRRTERFVENSDDVVVVVDSDGFITYASGSSHRVLGYDPDELVGENFFDYLHPDTQNRVMERYFSATEDPEAEFHTVCRLSSSDDGWQEIALRCQNMLSDDAIDGMLLYLRES
jgi:PAS domain S-box-containing protein